MLDLIRRVAMMERRERTNGTEMAAGIVLLSALLACGSSVTQEAEPAETVTTPAGREGHTVECEKLAGCYAQASEQCPDGYVVVDSRESQRQASGAGEALRRAGEQLQGESYDVRNNQTGDTYQVEKRSGPASPPRTVGVREMLFECRAGSEPAAPPSTGIGAPCETADDCVRLRLALKKAGLASYVACARDLDAKPVCTFPCGVADDPDTSERLTKLCGSLRRNCIETGSDGEPATCHTGEP